MYAKMKNIELYEKSLPLAAQVIQFARDSILVNMRFLDVAMSTLTPEPLMNLNGVACDGRTLYYDPVFILKKYKKEPAYPFRLYLHVIFHMIFYHSYRYEKVNQRKWNVAADIAVENAILELDLHGNSLKRDVAVQRKLKVLKEDISSLTADKIYHYLQSGNVSESEISGYIRSFIMDDHIYWIPHRSEETNITLEEWKKISERVQAGLKSFSQGKNNSEGLEINLEQALKERYDYTRLLRRFTVMNEDMQLNDDEFDYVYYTYGLDRYGNMPLVEPLEYKDNRKVREFVIAIDTSASCRGPVVQAFLKKTYSILKGEDNFFRKMNVHIIQCDSEVRKDTKITSQEDFDRFLAKEKLTGFGSTDFRPVFSHVENLIKVREFENLKGLIYFTDGYGVYPTTMPPYDVMFVFLDNGDKGPDVPPWAIKVVLDYDELEE